MFYTTNTAGQENEVTVDVSAHCVVIRSKVDEIALAVIKG